MIHGAQRMTGIIDYFSLLGGMEVGFPIGENHLTFPHLIIMGDLSCLPPQNPDSAQINQPLIKGAGGGGGPLESCCTLAQRDSPPGSSLMCCGMERCFLQSSTPKSADSIPGGSVSTPLLTSSAHPPQDSLTGPLTLPVMGPKGQLKL